MTVVTCEREAVLALRSTMQEPDKGQVRTVAVSVGIVVGTAFGWLLLSSFYHAHATLDAFAEEALPLCGKRGTAAMRVFVSEMSVPPALPMILGSALFGVCVALASVETVRRCVPLYQPTREEGSHCSLRGKVVLLVGVSTFMAALSVVVCQHLPPTTTFLDEVAKKV